ncbi:MAG: glycosyl transferase family 1 [Thermodesulfobacteriota bacterium]|nr:MAG: glycosyl transferase family 1 [Thermodesulfobacteriota bacterium]
MSSRKRYKVGILSTHPIQYYVPWYRQLAKNPEVDLTVYFSHSQTSEDHGKAGYGISFDWDIPMLEGYRYIFLKNMSANPNVFNFFGCDTPEIKDIIKNGNFDAFIVEGWHKKGLWQAIFACWKTKTPLLVRGDSNLVSHGGGTIKRLVKYPIYNWFIPKFSAYLVVGKYAKEYYLHYGGKEEKMFFTPHCVDNEFFSNGHDSLLPNRGELRKKWNIPEDAVVFVLVGRLIPRKRPDDFISAIQKASKANPKIWGLIVGDGPIKSDIQNKSEREEIQIKFTGFLNQGELPMAYTVSDCLVNTSFSESWGLTINEAMASSLPALVSNTVGCAPDLVHPEETGHIFQCGNIDELSDVMISLASNTENLSRMGKNAFNFIQKYSIQNTADGVLEAIKSISNIKNVL